MATTFSRALRALPLALMLVPAAASAQWTYATNYPPYPYGAAESSLRTDIKPREAAVYLDGYYAGIVDDFDGNFQRLHTFPGQHEVTIYLLGYRTVKQQLYLSPHGTRTIKATLEPLAAGEVQDPEPVPTEPREREQLDEERGVRTAPYPGQRPDPNDPRAVPGYPGDRSGDPRGAGRPAPPSEPSRFGTVAIRVQPSGVAILIDGERWEGPSDDERLLVQLAPGTHKIEATKEGYRPFVMEVEVAAGQTANVNVGMSRDR